MHTHPTHYYTPTKGVATRTTHLVLDGQLRLHLVDVLLGLHHLLQPRLDGDRQLAGVGPLAAVQLLVALGEQREGGGCVWWFEAKIACC